jgi:hypothetical protein
MSNTPPPAQLRPAHSERALEAAQAALCATLLPVWGRHLAALRTQSETAVAGMLSAFSAMGLHLNQAARQSHQITLALAPGDGGITHLARACEQELQPLLTQLDEGAASTLRKVMGMIQKCVDELAQVAKPLEHETRLVSEQVERMYIGFQYQDRISQMMTLLQMDMDRLQAALTTPLADAQALNQDAWLARLESQYVMQEQRQQHTGSPTDMADMAGGAVNGTDTTFF